MKKTSTKNTKGFSLIEVIISVALLAIGVLAVAGGEFSILTSDRRTDAVMKGTVSAENMIEMIRRNTSPASLLAYGNFNTKSTSTHANPLVQADFNNWKTQVLAIDQNAVGTVVVGPGPMAGISQIAVTVLLPRQVVEVATSTFVVRTTYPVVVRTLVTP
jgi:prepilin-type N-terminal cleavage/methylation domain-containing protein